MFWADLEIGMWFEFMNNELLRSFLFLNDNICCGPSFTSCNWWAFDTYTFTWFVLVMTINACNIKCSCSKYSRLSLSRNRRDPQKHFDISVLRHIRFVVLRKKQFEQPNFINDYVIGLLNLEIYIENIVEKGRNCSLGAISPLFHNIL